MSAGYFPEVPPHEQEASTSLALNNNPQTDPVAFRFLSEARVEATLSQNLPSTPQLGAQSDPPGIIPISEVTDSNVEETTLLTDQLASSGQNVQPYGMYHGLLPTRATALGSGVMLTQGARLQLMVHQPPTSDPVSTVASSSEANTTTSNHQHPQSGNVSVVDNITTPNNQIFPTSDAAFAADNSITASHQQSADLPPSNASDPQDQEYHRRREEQRQLLLAAAQRRAAMTAATVQHSSDSTQSLEDSSARPSATSTLSTLAAPREDPPSSNVGTPIFAPLQELDLLQSTISHLALPSIAAQSRPSPLIQHFVALRSNSGTERTTIEQNLQVEQRQQEEILSPAENTTNTAINVESVRNSERIPIREGIAILPNIAGGPPQVLMPQQPGTPHRTIRLPPGARQFTVPVGIGAHIRIQGSLATNPVQDTNNNPNMIPRVPVTPLEAQAIPYRRPNDVTENKEGDGPDVEDEQYDKYRCTICYEFLANPSSCGKCSSRFCYACLVRVATTNNSTTFASSTTNMNQVGKCPGCRTLLTVEGIVRDTSLQEELRAANLQVLCSYPGCGQRLPAATVKEHELTCEYTPLRCKNSTLGCTWNGVRKDIEHHLSHHCPLERVAGLVDQFRQNRADHQAAILALQRSQNMSSQLTQVNSDLMRRLLPSSTNIFDLVYLTYTASCTTPYFLYTSDVWRSFLGQPGAAESRAMLSNLLYLLPTIFNVCRTAIGGYRLLLSLGSDQDLQTWATSMELGALSITPFLLLITAGLCFLLDGLSSTSWSLYRYFGLWERKILRDLATLSFLLINLIVIECDDAGSASVFLWMCVFIATCCFPPVVLTILGLASGTSEPNPHQIFMSGRSTCIVLFTLRHAAVAAFIGIIPAIDGAIVIQLLRRSFTRVIRYDLVPVSDGLYSSIRTGYLFAIVGARLAIGNMSTPVANPTTPGLTMLASVAFLIINFTMHQLTQFGIVIGRMSFQEGRANLLPNQSGIRNTFSVTGTLAFALWGSILLVLAVTF